MRHILKFYWQHCRINMIITIFIKVINGVLPVVGIFIFEQLINEIVGYIQGQNSQQLLIILFLSQIFVTILPFATNHIVNINDQYITNKITFQNAKLLLDKVGKLNFIRFENPSFYNEFQRTYGNKDKIIEGFNSLVDIISTMVSIISVIYYLFLINWTIVVVIILGVLPYTFIQLKFNKKYFTLISKLVPIGRKKDYILNLLHRRDTLKEIKLFNAFNFLKDKWDIEFKKYAKENVNFIIQKSKLIFVSELIVISTYVIGGIIVILNLNPATAAGSLIATLQSIQLFQSSITELSGGFSQFKNSNIFIDDFKHFLEDKSHVATNNKKKTKKYISEIHKIEIKNLSFKYPSGKIHSIKDINLELKKGERVAIVGENGCGKSTLMKCLSGLYIPESSDIYINDIPLDKVDIDSYYRRVSVLFQDFIKYELTARENIGIGNVDEIDNKTEIIKASSISGINDYINQLGTKYNTLLGRFFEGGQELSGGQWQKVAIARALFRKGDIVILDEPTSSLDPLSEKNIFESLIRNYSGSVVFVTHRLGIANLADKIIVMDKGEIVERGSHKELLAHKGLYSKMYASQSYWHTKREGVKENEIMV